MPNIKTYSQIQLQRKMEKRAKQFAKIVIFGLLFLSLFGNIYLAQKVNDLNKEIAEIQQETPDYFLPQD